MKEEKKTYKTQFTLNELLEDKARGLVEKGGYTGILEMVRDLIRKEHDRK